MAQDNVAGQDEYKFPDEVEKQQTSNEQVAGEPSVVVEVEDDTPPADRGREPMPEKVVQELEQDDLAQYGEKVRERLSQLKKVYHDERRAKESAEREKQEALRLAQQVYQENQNLKNRVNRSETTLIGTFKDAAVAELAKAKRDYKEAFESGDVDRITEAQESLARAVSRADYAIKIAARPQQPIPSGDSSVQNNTYNPQQAAPQPVAPPLPRPDPKAVEWTRRNTWFGENKAMTAFAMGVHAELTDDANPNKVHPQSNEYYELIDARLRSTFPDYFGGNAGTGARPEVVRKPTVVAPATRSVAGVQRVTLTKTQEAIAKKLGISKEAYAKEILKLQKEA